MRHADQVDPADSNLEVESLTEYLSNQGHSDFEVRRIIEKVREYDKRMINESVFDSIAAGTFNLNAIVNEVIGKPR